MCVQSNVMILCVGVMLMLMLTQRKWVDVGFDADSAHGKEVVFAFTPDTRNIRISGHQNFSIKSHSGRQAVARVLITFTCSSLNFELKTYNGCSAWQALNCFSALHSTL